jgi:cysteine desulfurase
MRRIYLDNNATTPVHPEVIAAMLPFFRHDFGNPSCRHWAGRNVRKAVEHAREQVASLINCDPSEVIFTSGGSESVNMAVKGLTAASRSRGNHIVTTQVEHPAVFNSCRYLERQGFRVSYLGVDGEGRLDPETIEDACTDETVLIAAMLANNETGTILPVREIGKIAAGKGICILTDAVQAVGKIPVDFRQLSVDMLTISGHKLHGPKGIGALIVRKDLHIHPIIHGGSQEKNRRAGTENVPGIIGFGAACEIACKTLDSDHGRILGLREKLERRILENIPDVKINGHPLHRLPNTLNISFHGAPAGLLLEALDGAGVAVSAGSACSAGSRELSRVLTALGLESSTIRSAVRFSLGRENTSDDIEYVLDVLPSMIDRLRNDRQTP